ncbi:hypothetical protein BCR34DRAFT_577846, partial [Clohesyomyces aquaticus]
MTNPRIHTGPRTKPNPASIPKPVSAPPHRRWKRGPQPTIPSSERRARRSMYVCFSS